MIRALVVDDEPLARERLRTLLAEEPDLEVVAECNDGMEAVRAISEHRPDLVFLDVQMPELDGFEVLEALDPGRVPAVVFVTAHDEYAIRAFEVHALDYLLKPFDRTRFRRALARARADLAGAAGEVRRRLAALLEDLEPGRKTLDRVVVKSGGRVVFLSVEEIDRIEAAGNYVELHADGRRYLLRETLKGMVAKLDPDRFVRVHRSHVVNLDRVVEMEPWFHGEFVLRMRDGSEVPSSRTYGDRLRALLDNRPG